MEDVKVVMLGTGNPNANPDRSGPAVAIIINNETYLIDFGPGIVRQSAKAFKQYNIEALKPKNLKTAFLTHLHSDHTIGYPDLILSPWVLGREEALQVYGPKGIKYMTKQILKAYRVDILGRLDGYEPSNRSGYKVDAFEIEEGTVYEDDNVIVEAFSVSHEPFESYGYKFIIGDKSIVISGDTKPTKKLIEKAMNCSLLIHEVYSSTGIEDRSFEWKNYHENVHTSSIELGLIASKVQPKQLVLYHQLFMQNLQDNEQNLIEILEQREQQMVEEVKYNFDGIVVSAKDLDLFTL